MIFFDTSNFLKKELRRDSKHTCDRICEKGEKNDYLTLQMRGCLVISLR